MLRSSRVCLYWGQWALAVVLAFAAASALAAPPADAERLARALGRAELLLRDAATREAATQRELAELRAARLVLEQTAADWRTRALAAEGELGDARRRGQPDDGELRAARQRVQRLETRVATLDGESSRLRAQAAELDAARAALAEELARAKAALADAEARNLALYRKHRELLQSLRRKLGIAELGAREPLLGLSRVEQENRLEALEYEAFDLLLDANLAAVREAP